MCCGICSCRSVGRRVNTVWSGDEINSHQHQDSDTSQADRDEGDNSDTLSVNYAAADCDEKNVSNPETF